MDGFTTFVATATDKLVGLNDVITQTFEYQPQIQYFENLVRVISIYIASCLKS